MINILDLVKKGAEAILNKLMPYKRTLIPAGAGFYAFKVNRSRSGKVYTKLVKKDNSRVLDKHEREKLVPYVKTI